MDFDFDPGALELNVGLSRGLSALSGDTQLGLGSSQEGLFAMNPTGMNIPTDPLSTYSEQLKNSGLEKLLPNFAAADIDPFAEFGVEGILPSEYDAYYGEM